MNHIILFGNKIYSKRLIYSNLEDKHKGSNLQYFYKTLKLSSNDDNQNSKYSFLLTHLKFKNFKRFWDSKFVNTKSDLPATFKSIKFQVSVEVTQILK